MTEQVPLGVEWHADLNETRGEVMPQIVPPKALLLAISPGDTQSSACTSKHASSSASNIVFRIAIPPWRRLADLMAFVGPLMT